MDSQKWVASATLSLVVIGCIGNTISFVLFSRPHMRSSSVNVLLCALSFIDFSLLLLTIPTFVIPNLGLWGDSQGAISFLAYVLKFVYPVNLIMQTCSVYTMVMITFERWTAVCRPLQVRVWCSPKKSRMAILIIFLVAVSYNAIRFFEYRLIHAPEGAFYERWLRDPVEHKYYYVGYYTILFIVTHFLLPFTVMAFLNGHVILSMWRLRRMRQMLTRQQQREHSTTVMLLIVTFVFALCNTLPFLLNIAEGLFPDLFTDERTSHIAYVLNDLSTLLVVLNSATTFVVYFSFSEKYRQTFTFLLSNGCCASNQDYNTYQAMSRTASMRVSSTCEVVRTGSKVSNASKTSDVLLKPLFMQKRGERCSSEYNERTCKYTEEMRLPRLPNEKQKKKKHKLSAIEARIPPEITVTFSEDSPSREAQAL